ncbi:MAG: DUF4199 domain-containing protein [Bacteroidales bacterium]|nr:DUF4199 domain-containing protein [Bacteroidales bacterium]
MDKWKNRLMYGGIAGGILFLYYLTVNVLLDIDFSNKFINFIQFLPVITLLVFSMVKGTKKYFGDNNISYSEAFKHGFFICCIAYFIGHLADWIKMSFLGGREEAGESLYNMLYDTQGYEIAEQSSEIIQLFTTPLSLLLYLFISAIVTSIIVAVIVAAFTKKENPF